MLEAAFDNLISVCLIRECAQILVNAHIAAPDNKLRVVYKKYMLEQFGGVACYPPAVSLIEGLKSGGAPKSSSWGKNSYLISLLL